MKKTIIMAAIIGLVGGALEALTDWRKIWCFLAGVGALITYLLVLSIIKTAVIMRKTKGSKTIVLDQYNNINIMTDEERKNYGAKRITTRE